MIPVAGIIGAFWLVRALSSNRQGQAASGAGSPWSALYLILAVIAWPLLLTPLWAGWGGLLFALPAFAVALPGTTVRLVLIPLGRYRLAYWWSHLAVIDWRDDVVGGSAVASAWALLQRGRIDAGDIAWIERRLEQVSQARASGLLATGLLCAARGDAGGARQILESLSWLDSSRPARPVTALRLASEYVYADAASRGEWSRIVELAKRPKQRTTRSGRLLVALARRLTHQKGAPSPFGICLRWAWAPRRRHTLGFVRRALEHPQRAEALVEPPEVPLDSDPLARAVRFQAALMARPLTLAALRQAGQLWDDALDRPELAKDVAERTLALGAPDATGLRDELRRTVSDDLAEKMLESGVCLEELDDSPLLAAVARRARSSLLDEVESLASALGDRVAEHRVLPPADDWRELVALRTAYERAARCGGDEVRRLAFPSVCTAAGNAAVWLWNDLKERAIAHGVFCWLRDEAQLLADSRRYELYAKNAKLRV